VSFLQLQELPGIYALSPQRKMGKFLPWGIFHVAWGIFFEPSDNRAQLWLIGLHLSHWHSGKGSVNTSQLQTKDARRKMQVVQKLGES